MAHNIHYGKTNDIGSVRIHAYTSADRYASAPAAVPLDGPEDLNDSASSRGFIEPHRVAFAVGCRVRLAQTSPIESEGVAPEPGDEGELIASPLQSDNRRCWTVHFFAYSLPWKIPEQYLTPVIDC